jgi:hypothetical protein
MKMKKKVIQEVDVKWIVMCLPVYYGDEDIPLDFPFRKGDQWEVKVDLETGVIDEWPAGRSAEFHMKVTDGGTYTLLSESGEVIATREEEYVPQCVPGAYGDYVELSIEETGRITNWPKKPDMRDFEGGDD